MQQRDFDPSTTPADRRAGDTLTGHGKPFDAYAILGVAPDAAPDEIKAAFRAAAKASHPDAGGTVEAFVRVRRAYFVLSDPDRRRRYDESGIVDETSKLSFHTRVSGCLASLFDEFLRSGTAFRRDVDVIAAMRQSAQNKVDELEKQRVEVRAVVGSLDDLAGRIDRPEGENFFAKLIAERQRKLEEALRRIVDDKAVVEAALAELAGYTCLHEMAQQIGIQAFFTDTTTSGTTT